MRVFKMTGQELLNMIELETAAYRAKHNTEPTHVEVTKNEYDMLKSFVEAQYYYGCYDVVQQLRRISGLEIIFKE